MNAAPAAPMRMRRQRALLHQQNPFAAPASRPPTLLHGLPRLRAGLFDAASHTTGEPYQARLLAPVQGTPSASRGSDPVTRCHRVAALKGQRPSAAPRAARRRERRLPGWWPRCPPMPQRTYAPMPSHALESCHTLPTRHTGALPKPSAVCWFLPREHYDIA